MKNVSPNIFSKNKKITEKKKLKRKNAPKMKKD